MRRLHDSSGVRLRIPAATSKELVKRCGRWRGTNPATQALRLPTPTPRMSTFLQWGPRDVHQGVSWAQFSY